MATAILRALMLAICFTGAVTARAAVIDEAWQEVAVAALGGREGAVLVMDPRTGQLLAVVNPRLASEQAYPPGSTIKPFTLLSALGAGRVAPGFAHRCRGGYRQGTRNLLCSHPRIDSPFSLVEGLAYSCNDLFLLLCNRLTASSFIG